MEYMEGWVERNMADYLPFELKLELLLLTITYNYLYEEHGGEGEKYFLRDIMRNEIYTIVIIPCLYVVVNTRYLSDKETMLNVVSFQN